MDTNSDKLSIKVIKKAMQIMDLFSIEEPRLTLNQISEQLGQKKTTLYKILETLVEVELLEKYELTKQYSLGLGILKYSTVVMHHMDLRRFGSRHIAQLSKDLGSTVSVGVLRGNAVILIDVVRSLDLLHPLTTNMGFKDPVHSTAMGKVLLAYKTSEEARAILESILPLKRYTNKTITDVDDLMNSLQEFRRLGYALESEEFMEGMKCIGIPIFNHANEAIAAIGITLAINNNPGPIDNALLEKVFQTAANISDAMGCQNYFSVIESYRKREFA
jgi:Transcriptional regulator